MTDSDFISGMDITYGKFRDRLRKPDVPAPTLKQAFEEGFHAAVKLMEDSLPTKGNITIELQFQRKPTEDNIKALLLRTRDGLRNMHFTDIIDIQYDGSVVEGDKDD